MSKKKIPIVFSQIRRYSSNAGEWLIILVIMLLVESAIALSLGNNDTTDFLVTQAYFLFIVGVIILTIKCILQRHANEK
jgi:hypothetical protein